jgi:hypothetical protein
MKIKIGAVHFVEYENQDYLRLGPEMWLRRYGESYETEHYCHDEEAAFQKQLKEDFESDKYA